MNETPEERQERETQERLDREEYAAFRAKLLTRYGQVWNTEELHKEFDVIAFSAPIVSVRRKSDGRLGSMEFSHWPRFYFQFIPNPTP